MGRCRAVDLQQFARIEQHVGSAVGWLEHLDLESRRRLTGIALGVCRADVLLDRYADRCRVTRVAPGCTTLAGRGAVQVETPEIARPAIRPTDGVREDDTSGLVDGAGELSQGSEPCRCPRAGPTPERDGVIQPLLQLSPTAEAAVLDVDGAIRSSQRRRQQSDDDNACHHDYAGLPEVPPSIAAQPHL